MCKMVVERMGNMIKFLTKILVIIIILFCAISFYLYKDPIFLLRPRVEIEKISFNIDKDEDGTYDLEDIIEGARGEIENKTKYKSGYYEGGYPPENEGVCTDVIWRALKNAGYDLKTMMDIDIKEKVEDYPRVNNSTDPNIDFRRVKNQFAFFSKYAQSLVIEVKPYDKENLKKWQGGDIVVLQKPDHIAIISDKRTRHGIPYIIHNSSSYPEEQNLLLWWSKRGRIIGHFRYPKIE